MKKFVPMLLTGTLAVSMAGCTENSAPVATNLTETPATAATQAVEGMFVSLSVPNMT